MARRSVRTAVLSSKRKASKPAVRGTKPARPALAAIPGVRRYKSKAEHEAQYSPRSKHPDCNDTMIAQGWKSAALRKHIPVVLDLRYGDAILQTLDVYKAVKSGGPTLIFIHGGYWRIADKNIFTFMAEHLCPAGVTMFSVNYDLCPNVTVEQIVGQVRDAVVWVHKNAAGYGGDPNRIYICGHSAGGHLTAMIMATDWSKYRGFDATCIKGAIPISGVMETRPLPTFSLNAVWSLTPEMAARVCPMVHPPRLKVPQLVAAAAGETDEFIAMSRDYAALLKSKGIPCEFLLVAATGHFTIMDQFSQPGSPLLSGAMRLMGIA
jgi:arylformamidase